MQGPRRHALFSPTQSDEPRLAVNHGATRLQGGGDS